MAKRTFIGAGKVYMEEVGGTGGLLFLGLVDKLEVNPAQEKKELRDATKGGGGTYDAVERIQGVAAAMTLRELSSANLALALYGNTTAATAGAVTAEVHTARVGALLVFNNQPDLSVPFVVEPAGGGTAYVLGTDYEMSGAGILILAGGAIANAASIQVGYTKVAGSVVQAFVTSGKTYRLFFEGVNDADNGKQVHVDIYRFKPSPTSSLALIGDDFAELPLEGSVLANTAIVAQGLSQYLNIKSAN